VLSPPVALLNGSSGLRSRVLTLAKGRFGNKQLVDGGASVLPSYFDGEETKPGRDCLCASPSRRKTFMRALSLLPVKVCVEYADGDEYCRYRD